MSKTELWLRRVAKESVRNLRLSRREYHFPGERQSQNARLRFGKKAKLSVSEKDDCAILRVNKSKDNLFKASHLKKALDNDDSKEDGTQTNSPGEGNTPMSASQLLSSMRRRNHEEIHKQEELDFSQAEEENELFGFNISQAAGGPSDYVPNPTEHDELMTELRNFIAFQCQVDGQAKTSEIMEEFGSKVRPEHAAIFKSILKELCTSQRLPGLQENVWKLKPEFQ